MIFYIYVNKKLANWIGNLTPLITRDRAFRQVYIIPGTAACLSLRRYTAAAWYTYNIGGAYCFVQNDVTVTPCIQKLWGFRLYDSFMAS